jgi:HEAT repeat protein
MFALAVSFTHAEEKRPLTALEIHRWTKQLSSGDWVQQAVALKHLGEWKIEQSVPAIRKIFEQGKSSWIQGQAMLALAKIEGKEMIPTAQQAAREKDPILRKAALQTFDLVGGAISEKVARELLQDPDVKVRALAVALYASQSPEEAWPTVDRLTPPGKETMSKDLLRALAHVGSAEALARLETLFHVSEANDRRKKDVIQALGMAPDDAIGLLARLTARFEPNQPEFQVGRKLLAARPKDKLAVTFKEMLLAQDTAQHASTASLVAEVCPTKALGDLMSTSWIQRKDMPEKAIQSGLMALSEIEPARYKKFFMHFLQSKDPITRAMAVRCRGLIIDKDLFDSFRVYVHDEHPEVARVALNSLLGAPVYSKPKEGLMSYLRKSLGSADDKVLLAALALLGKRGEEREFDLALDALKPLLEEGENIKREAAARALAQLSDNKRLADISRAQGFIGHWQIVGPFLNDNRNTGYEKEYEPEQQKDAKSYKAEYRWEFGGGQSNDRELELTWEEARSQTAEGDVHLAAHMTVPIRHAVAYTKVQVNSNLEQAIRLLVDVREKTSQKIWLNGKIVADLTIQQNELGGTIEERRAGGPSRTKGVKVSLRKGTNQLLIKTATFGGRWWMRLRIMDERNKRMAQGVTLVTPKPKVE